MIKIIEGLKEQRGKAKDLFCKKLLNKESFSYKLSPARH